VEADVERLRADLDRAHAEARQARDQDTAQLRALVTAAVRDAAAP
jgi:hypothetical protein